MNLEKLLTSKCADDILLFAQIAGNMGANKLRAWVNSREGKELFKDLEYEGMEIYNSCQDIRPHGVAAHWEKFGKKLYIFVSDSGVVIDFKGPPVLYGFPVINNNTKT